MFDIDKIRKERRMLCRDIIYNFLKINFSNVTDLGEDTVVLQIRSGDIFSTKNKSWGDKNKCWGGLKNIFITKNTFQS